MLPFYLVLGAYALALLLDALWSYDPPQPFPHDRDARQPGTWL